MQNNDHRLDMMRYAVFYCDPLPEKGYKKKLARMTLGEYRKLYLGAWAAGVEYTEYEWKIRDEEE